MLAKLLKYEMKASARTLVPLYIGTLLVALVCSVVFAVALADDGAYMHLFAAMYGGAGGIVVMFGYLLYFALCVAITVLTIMIIIQRFNKSLVGDEGYLMFTLPVTHTQLLSSKLAAAMLWVLAGMVVMGLSALIMFLPGIMINSAEGWFDNVLEQILDITQYWVPYLFTSIVSGLLNIAAMILMVYVSIMIAQTERFSKHRVAVAVVLFFAINWAFGLVETGILYSGFMNVYDHLNALVMNGTEDFMWAGRWLLLAQAAFALVQCIICFIATKWLMQNKLNL